MSYQVFDENKRFENNIVCLDSIWLLTEQCPLLLHFILTKALLSRSARCCYFPILQMKKLSPSWFSSQKPGSMWQSTYGLAILSFYPVLCQHLISGCKMTSDDEWLMASSGVMHSSVTPAFPMVPSTRVIITSSFWLPKASPPAIHQNPL